MDRRDTLLALAGAGLLAASGSAAASNHQHHGHHGHSMALHDALIAAASKCVSTGEACLAHCLVLLADGDKPMAACAQSVNETLAICGALRSLAGQQSNHTPAMAKVALDACLECEKECKKHADKHAECKACMEACADCARECKKLIG